jgi:hypothetical protein
LSGFGRHPDVCPESGQSSDSLDLVVAVAPDHHAAIYRALRAAHASRIELRSDAEAAAVAYLDEMPRG